MGSGGPHDDRALHLYASGQRGPNEGRRSTRGESPPQGIDMATEVVVYTVVHQPRRLKLPAQPIPAGAGIDDIVRCVFDERMNERYFRKVSNTCYYPATELFLRLVRGGMKLAIGFSVSFLRQAEAWDPALLGRFQELVAHPNVELIGVEPYHNFVFLLDMPLFVERMRWMGDEMQRIFGQRPRITDTTEMCMSASIYDALDQAGYDAALLDGRPWVMGWREPTHLYHYDGRPRLFCRHLELSDDVGYRFSDRTWNGFPLYAEDYAAWLRAAWGEFVFIGWDFETFGEHHWRHSGIFEFMDQLPYELDRRGVGFLKPGEALARWGKDAYHLPLPVFPTTIQWFGRSGPEAEVSAYFTPREWWDIGPQGIIVEQQRVYQNVLRAMEPHLPGRIRPVTAAPRRAARPLEPIGIEQRY